MSSEVIIYIVISVIGYAFIAFAACRCDKKQSKPTKPKCTLGM